ncbi:plasmid mobilization protein [Priestia endophytica]|uniref:plasmid mobilization protein n=1 Tax=Priestia endophytica TaxID=135735 RepID=UPI0022811AA1|nr:hypothetical protein [Priestia endophytica]MCY8232456.1 hypothetical protein [Priestia endophytica]
MSENRNERRQIKFRVSDDEFERLEQMATEFQMSVPKFCKMKAQGARMRPPKIDREGAFEVARQLRVLVQKPIPRDIENQFPLSC